MIGNDYKIIAVDFDNTLFETEYPTILRPISPVIEMAKERRAKGDKVILWTCREGAELDAAVEACRAEGLEFDAVNDNLPEEKAKWGNNSRKVAADEYWDDHNHFIKELFHYTFEKALKCIVEISERKDIQAGFMALMENDAK